MLSGKEGYEVSNLLPSISMVFIIYLIFATGYPSVANLLKPLVSSIFSINSSTYLIYSGPNSYFYCNSDILGFGGSGFIKFVVSLFRGLLSFYIILFNDDSFLSPKGGFTGLSSLLVSYFDFF